MGTTATALIGLKAGALTNLEAESSRCCLKTLRAVAGVAQLGLLLCRSSIQQQSSYRLYCLWPQPIEPRKQD